MLGEPPDYDAMCEHQKPITAWGELFRTASALADDWDSLDNDYAEFLNSAAAATDQLSRRCPDGELGFTFNGVVKSGHRLSQAWRLRCTGVMTPATATPTAPAPSTASRSDPGSPHPARLWEIHRVHAPLVSSAVHAGHGMRPEMAAGHRLPEDERLREEDPFTNRLLPASGSRVVVHRSRFECDLNRPRDKAVYRTPDDAWGLELWHEGAPSEALVERSLARYDAFYRDLEHLLEEVTREWGRVAFYDVHSYNHRRGGPGAAPDDPRENPVINLGTGNLDRQRWAPVVDTFLAEMARQEVGGAPLDVRENVRFRGGHLSDWICRRFPRSVCPLAIEVKKVFMDEWSGEPDDDAIGELRAALTATVPAVTAALHRVGARPAEEG